MSFAYSMKGVKRDPEPRAKTKWAVKSMLLLEEFGWQKFFNSPTPIVATSFGVIKYPDSIAFKILVLPNIGSLLAQQKRKMYLGALLNFFI